MKIITDGFEALDAIDFAKSEGMTFIVKANTITAKHRTLPKMNAFQIRTRGIDADTVADLKKNDFMKDGMTALVAKNKPIQWLQWTKVTVYHCGVPIKEFSSPGLAQDWMAKSGLNGLSKRFER